MTRMVIYTGQGRLLGILLVFAALVPAAARPANADLYLSFSPETSSVAAGSVGDSFDVTLTNSGTSAVAIGAFAFELSVSSSYVSFTSATTATSSPYIFAGSSFEGPTISTSPPTLPGEVLEASDLSTLSDGVTLASSASVGLGHVLFDVSPSARNSMVSVTFAAFPDTSVTAPDLSNISITLGSGEIDIVGLAVPEPSIFNSMFGIFTTGFGVIAAGGVARRLGRRR